jgi:hypothetical protein
MEIIVGAAELLIGDKTEWGVVSCVVSKRKNTTTKVTFENGDSKEFKKFDKITVLN